MASINGINSGIDYSVFFGSSSTSSADGVDLTSYMSIKNYNSATCAKDGKTEENKAAVNEKNDVAAV